MTRLGRNVFVALINTKT